MDKSVPEKIADQVFALLPSGPEVLIGRKHRDTFGKRARVVMVPRGAPDIKEARKVGNGMHTDAGRMLYERGFVMEWDCYGVGTPTVSTDFYVAEQLYKLVLIAVRTVCHASVLFQSERWLSQDEDDGDSLDRKGEVIRFTSIIDLALYEAQVPTVELTSIAQIDTTYTLNGNEE